MLGCRGWYGYQGYQGATVAMVRANGAFEVNGRHEA